MAIVVSSALTAETDSTASNSSTTTSGTFNVNANTLYLVAVTVNSQSGTWAPSGDPTLTGGGASSWVLAAEVESFSSRQVYVFRTSEASPSGAAALTFTAPGSETYNFLIISAWQVAGATATGTAGADGVVATNTATQDQGVSATTSVSASPAMTSGNGAVGVFGVYGTSAAVVSVRSGYTNLGNTTIAGNMSHVVIYRADTDTAADVTYNSSGGVRAAVFVEVETAAAAASAGQVVTTYYNHIQ